MNDFREIIARLPYQKPFLFVDRLKSLDENRVIGYYRFKKEEYFYRGHFKNEALTPGVILTECMAQIGLACLGIYLNPQLQTDQAIALSESKMEFLEAVYPGEEIKVIADKVYWRLGKLKVKAEAFKDQKLCCRGELSGLLIRRDGKIARDGKKT